MREFQLSTPNAARAVLAALLFGLGGCGGASVSVPPELPVPLVEQIPLAMGIHLSDELLAYAHEEEIEDSGEWTIEFGSAQQLMYATLYNDANAYRARMVGAAAEHEWSTGPLHAARPGSLIPAELWSPSDWYLGLGHTDRERGDAYERLMSAYVAADFEPPRASPVIQMSEQRDVQTYRRRLERPNGSSARERGSSRFPRGTQ